MKYHVKYKIAKFLLRGFRLMYIEDYAPPTLRERPTHFIFHVGANDIPIKEDPNEIANNIANLATKLKRNCDVSVSGIIARNNQFQWKAADVNQLNQLCSYTATFKLYTATI